MWRVPRPVVRTGVCGYRVFVVCACRFYCAVPVLIGFVYPVVKLGYWAIIATEGFDFGRFFKQAGSSLMLASMAALIVSLLAFYLAFAVRTHAQSKLCKLVQLSTLGYAIPSVVTGVGVMVLLAGFDRILPDSLGALTLSGSLVAISFAYVVRFMTVAYQPLSAGMQWCAALCTRRRECWGRGSGKA